VLLAARAASAFSGDAEAGSAKSRPCAPCHGSDGNAKVPGIPSLAGQSPTYTQRQLMKFRDGDRKNDQMITFVARLSDADMADLAAFYATQKAWRRTPAVDPHKVEAGKKAAGVHQCASCHLADFGGQDQAPRLAGQDLAYLRRSIRAFNEKTLSHPEGRMTTTAVPLTDEDIDVLAHFLASLGGEK
jgi:cytochrome c553